jgi:2-methylisocitrate lyase-like PEP mutase family enzyme
VIPNPWDVGSARYLQHLGFSALATTSAGFAFSQGLPDSGDDAVISRDRSLGYISSITAAVDLPVSADFMSGYGLAPEDVAESVAQCVTTGVAGLSIEDATGDPMSPLYDLPIAVERVRAARQAIDRSGGDVLLTARAECYHTGHPDAFREFVRRLQAYAEAGADVLFAPGPQNPAEIKALVEAAAPRPLNVLVVRDIGLTVGNIAALGVRRISLSGALALAAWTGFMRTGLEVGGQLRWTVESGRVCRRQRPLRHGSRASCGLSWWRQGLPASDKTRHKCEACGRSLLGDDSMSLLPKLKVRSSGKLGWPDLSMLSGDDRKVSIRTTLATLPTRAQDTAGRACRDSIDEASAAPAARRRGELR